MGWQPIETAPRPDKWVLVWSKEGGVEKARFEEHIGPDGRWQIMETAEYDNDGADIPPPTHWMPLPNPPEGTDHD